MVLRQILTLVGTMLISLLGVATMESQQSATSGCEVALVQTKVAWQYDQSLRLSLLKLVDRETFNTKRKSVAGGADIPVNGVPLSAFGNYDSFAEARSQEFTKLDYKYDYDEAQNYLATYTPEAAFGAFSECLRLHAQHGYGLHLIAKEISRDYVSVDAYWNPPPNVGDVDVTTFTISGHAVPVDAPKRLIANAYFPIDVQRRHEEPFRLVIAAGGYPPARLAVPLPATIPLTQRQPWEVPGYRPRLDLLAHVQGLGDVNARENRWIGIKGQQRRLEGFQISISDSTPGLAVEYMCHVQGLGDSDYLAAGKYCGTKGESRRLEGFAMRLVGSLAPSYRISYSCHVQGMGDVGPIYDGGYCGTKGQKRRVEAMLVYIERTK